MIIEPRKAIGIPYTSRFTGYAQVSVVSTLETKVLALTRGEYLRYKVGPKYETLNCSILLKSHGFLVLLTLGQDWNLVIENPWSQEVEVHYGVVELPDRGRF